MIRLALRSSAKTVRETLQSKNGIFRPLLKAVLVKLFCDRQLSVEPAVIEYLSLRMERSMYASFTRSAARSPKPVKSTEQRPAGRARRLLPAESYDIIPLSFCYEF